MSWTSQRLAVSGRGVIMASVVWVWGLGVATTGWGAVDFVHQVVPILRTHCGKCHTGDQLKGGFSLNDRASLMEGGESGVVVKVGDAMGSRLLEVVVSEDPDDRMPPKGERLSAAEVAVLTAWVNDGAVWDEGFSFKPTAYDPPLKPRRPELPVAVDGRDHPIDRLIDTYLADKQLPRPEPLEDTVFLRRVGLDLVGLLPPPDDVERFLADPSPDRRAAVIESLLSGKVAYAEHWLTFWNDLLRNDYAGTGYIDGGRRQISAWLYEALLSNMPFDQFARELIAPPTDESRGFIGGIKWRGEVSAGQTVEVQFAQSVAQTFLGLNMKCASCHDSFTDRWKLDEAYGLAAIFSERELEIARCDKGTGRMAAASWIFPEIGQIDAAAPQPERLKQLAGLMTHRENGRFTRTIVNRLWHRLMGRGIVHPVDAMQSEPWHEDLLDFLAEHLVDSGYDLKKTLTLIATSQAYQSRAQVVPAETSEKSPVYAGPRAKRLTAEQFVDAIWQLTGTAPTRFDAPFTRGAAGAAGAPGESGPALSAQWIWGASARDGASPPAGEVITLQRDFDVAGPITRAVAVMTCDNEFKLVVNGQEVSRSENWEQMAVVDLTGALQPGANRLTVVAKNAGAGPNPAGLFFEARFVLAEGAGMSVVSDAGWRWRAGVDEARAGGALWEPAVVVPALDAWSQVAGAQAPGLLAAGMKNESRMIRAVLMNSDPLMRALGRPNREQIVSMRPHDLTTLEAMDLSNGSILAGALERGAQRWVGRVWPDADALIRQLYLSALSRPPTAAELDLLRPVLSAPFSEQAVQDVLWALCMTPEFQLVR